MARQVKMKCMNNDMTMNEYSKFIIVQYVYDIRNSLQFWNKPPLDKRRCALMACLLPILYVYSFWPLFAKEIC